MVTAVSKTKPSPSQFMPLVVGKIVSLFLYFNMFVQSNLVTSTCKLNGLGRRIIKMIESV